MNKILLTSLLLMSTLSYAEDIKPVISDFVEYDGTTKCRTIMFKNMGFLDCRILEPTYLIIPREGGVDKIKNMVSVKSRIFEIFNHYKRPEMLGRRKYLKKLKGD